MAWSFPFSDEELQVFLQETDEQLAELESGLLDLERTGADADRLAAVFRAAHTLKGAAGAIGHEAMAKLTHALEGLLDAMRQGRLSPTPELCDAMLGAVDALTQIRGGIAGDGSVEPDLREQIDALQAQLPTASPVGGAPGPAASPVPAAAPAPGPAAAPAPASGPAAAPASAETSAARLRAAVLFDPASEMTAVRAYQALAAVRERGQVVEAQPSADDVEQGRVGERLDLVVAGWPADGLRTALQAIPDVKDVKVEAEADAHPKSHGGRPSVRVDVAVLDNLLNLVGELVIERTRLSQATSGAAAGSEGARATLAQISARLSRVTTDLQDEVMRARMLPVETLFRKFPRLVRDGARQLGKDIAFEMTGQDTELDRSVLEEIGDPLVHMLRNAVDHGIESAAERRARGKPERGTIRLSAEHRDNRVVIEVADDGAGIDPQRLRDSAVRRGLLGADQAAHLSRQESLELIFSSGMTTKEEATALSGRGVGMDVVRSNIKRLNGHVSVFTEEGRGTRFSISLPLTLAIVQALLVRIGQTAYALPLHSIVETFRVNAANLGSVQGEEVVNVRGQVLPLMRGGRLFGGGDGRRDNPAGRPIVHVNAGQQGVALLVDDLLGEQEIVIKALDQRLCAPAGVAGATILGDGDVALILDPATLLKGGSRVA